jgi:hypothetical protein
VRITWKRNKKNREGGNGNKKGVLLALIDNLPSHFLKFVSLQSHIWTTGNSANLFWILNSSIKKLSGRIWHHRARNLQHLLSAHVSVTSTLQQIIEMLIYLTDVIRMVRGGSLQPAAHGRAYEQGSRYNAGHSNIPYRLDVVLC